MKPAFHRFAMPSLQGPISGGTHYNRELVAALRRRGEVVRIFDSPDELCGFGWVDSLFLPTFPREARCGLIAHYLPSLVRYGENVRAEELEPFERRALEHAGAIIAPSPWMAQTLERLGARPQSVYVVAPGVSSKATVSLRSMGDRLRAISVGAVTPGKGMLALLEALLEEPDTGWTLDVVGSMDVDVAYARRCREAAASLPVRWLGMLEPDGCIEAIAAADVLVSASTMESYGMAIAEAQACGVPVLARAGGNVRALVERVRGGEVVNNAQTLARTLRRWAYDPKGHTRRVEAARADRVRRSWDDVASDFCEVSTSCERP